MRQLIFKNSLLYQRVLTYVIYLVSFKIQLRVQVFWWSINIRWLLNKDLQLTQNFRKQTFVCILTHIFRYLLLHCGHFFRTFLEVSSESDLSIGFTTFTLPGYLQKVFYDLKDFHKSWTLFYKTCRTVRINRMQIWKSSAFVPGVGWTLSLIESYLLSFYTSRWVD